MEMSTGIGCAFESSARSMSWTFSLTMVAMVMRSLKARLCAGAGSSPYKSR